ncbi:hypothetical protein CJ195_21150 [Bacillus sp. UMB0899]|nr:hypothetical protein CJ195_21150 [Bacillus sp. UMB0899]
MAGYYFKSGSRFMIKDNEYLVRRELELDYEIENIHYKIIELRRKEELLQLWHEGQLLFRISEEENKLLKTHNLDDLDDNLKRQAIERYNILKPIIKGEILPSEIDEYIKTLDGTVKKSAFYEWKKRWERTEDIRSLVPLKRGPKGSRSNKLKLKILDETIEYFLYSDGKHTIEDIYSEFIVRIDEVSINLDKKEKISYSSRSTIRRRKEQIIDIYKKDKEKYGAVLAKLMKDGSQQEVFANKPLQRVEIDWTPVDVMLIDPSDLKPKRPTLIYGVDKFSGMPLGFFITFKPVDSKALKQCLIHIIRPKTYIKKMYPLVDKQWAALGIPHTIVVDNASVNDSYEFEEACYQVGVKEVQFCKIDAGYQKGTIERAFRNLNTHFVHGLRGTTFSNFIEKGRYNSSEKACITMQGLIYMMHIAMVDMISHSYETRRGDSPHNIWHRGIENEPHLTLQIPRSIDELKIMLVAGSELRKIQHQGVVIENEYYYCKELIDLKNKFRKLNREDEKVRVRYDLSDMRKVFVHDPINNNYIIAKATSLQRKKINMGLPVPYIALEIDSKRRLEIKNSFDPKTRALAKRKIRLIQNRDKKIVKKWKKGQEPDETIDSSFLIDEVLPTNTEVEIQVGNEDIVILEEEINESKQKEIRKSKLKLKKSKEEEDNYKQNDFMEYEDTEIDELPSWGITLKNNKEDSDSCA